MRGTYIGKVADDDLGAPFCREMVGLDLAAPVAVSQNDDHGTGRCVVLVTPDGERTMSTYLGAAVTLMPSEARVALPEAFDILFIEGYIWDAPHGPEVIETLGQSAKAAGARVALSPSDAGCVERNLAAMRAFIDEHVDILIGNHHELDALAGTVPKDALDWALSQVATAAVTEHDKGSLVANASGRHHVARRAVARVVDTTGAGDAYASGFLAGLAQGSRGHGRAPWAPSLRPGFWCTTARATAPRRARSPCRRPEAGPERPPLRAHPPSGGHVHESP